MIQTIFIQNVFEFFPNLTSIARQDCNFRQVMRKFNEENINMNFTYTLPIFKYPKYMVFKKIP